MQQWTVVERRPVQGGYTPAERFRGRLPSGEWVFIKRGVDPLTTGWLRDEARAYETFGLACMPTMRFAGEIEGQMTLILEDLSGAHWPTPWRPGDVSRVIEALESVARAPVPSWVPTLSPSRLQCWHEVAADPQRLLRLGLCDSEWLERALPILLKAEGAWSDDLVLSHFDIRSDNLCIQPEGATIIDWNHACLAPRGLDLAFWAPSLAAEGERLPEELIGDAPGWAAKVSGFFASKAGLPSLPNAPGVREIQRKQLETALPWAARALGLPPPEFTRQAPPRQRP